MWLEKEMKKKESGIEILHEHRFKEVFQIQTSNIILYSVFFPSSSFSTHYFALYSRNFTLHSDEICRENAFRRITAIMCNATVDLLGYLSIKLMNHKTQVPHYIYFPVLLQKFPHSQLIKWEHTQFLM